MEAGGRRSDRPLVTAVDGLVALGIAEGSRDVRRQRHCAVTGGVGEDRFVRGTAHATDAFAEVVLDDEHGLTLGVHHGGAGAYPPTRLHQSPPGTVATGLSVRVEQHDLDSTPRRLGQRKTRSDDPRVVDDDHIAGSDEVGKLARPAVSELGTGGIEQPGFVARLDRRLGDPGVGQLVVEVVDRRHRASLPNMGRFGAWHQSVPSSGGSLWCQAPERPIARAAQSNRLGCGASVWIGGARPRWV